MKKILLPLFAVACVQASAQIVEVSAVDAKAKLDAVVEAGKATVSGDTYTENEAGSFKDLELAKTANVTAKIYSDNKYKLVTCVNLNSEKIRFNGSDDYVIEVNNKEFSLQGQSNGNQPTVKDDGSSNKPFGSLSDGSWLSFSRTGCQFSFKCEKNGYLYIVNKISSNKNYYVVAIKPNTDGSEAAIENGYAASYQVAGYFPGLSEAAGESAVNTILKDDVMNFTIPYTNDMPFYTGHNTILWPEDIATGSEYKDKTTVYVTKNIKEGIIPSGTKIYATYEYAFKDAALSDGPHTLDRLTTTTQDYYIGIGYDGKAKTCVAVDSESEGAGWCQPNKPKDLSKNAVGVIGVQVVKGWTYVVMARGSKLTLGGYAFSDKELKIEVGDRVKAAEEGAEDTWSWTVINDKEVFEVTTPTAITTPIADIVNDGAAYNLAGQRINGSAKGIVIKNGKKYLVK